VEGLVGENFGGKINAIVYCKGKKLGIERRILPVQWGENGLVFLKNLTGDFPHGDRSRSQGMQSNKGMCSLSSKELRKRRNRNLQEDRGSG